MQFAEDMELQEKIRQAIIDGYVSVYHVVCNGSLDSTDYSVTDKNGITYDFEQLRLFEDKGEIFYEYSIYIEGNDVACTILSDKKKTIAEPTQTILKLFQLCSSKVIYQEMQNTIHNNQIKNRFKEIN